MLVDNPTCEGVKITKNGLVPCTSKNVTLTLDTLIYYCPSCMPEHEKKLLDKVERK